MGVCSLCEVEWVLGGLEFCEGQRHAVELHDGGIHRMLSYLELLLATRLRVVGLCEFDDDEIC